MVLEFENIENTDFLNENFLNDYFEYIDYLLESDSNELEFIFSKIYSELVGVHLLPFDLRYNLDMRVEKINVLFKIHYKKLFNIYKGEINNYLNGKDYSIKVIKFGIDIFSDGVLTFIDTAKELEKEIYLEVLFLFVENSIIIFDFYLRDFEIDFITSRMDYLFDIYPRKYSDKNFEFNKLIKDFENIKPNGVEERVINYIDTKEYYYKESAIFLKLFHKFKSNKFSNIELEKAREYLNSFKEEKIKSFIQKSLLKDFSENILEAVEKEEKNLNFSEEFIRSKVKEYKLDSEKIVNDLNILEDMFEYLISKEKRELGFEFIKSVNEFLYDSGERKIHKNILLKAEYFFKGDDKREIYVLKELSNINILNNKENLKYLKEALALAEKVEINTTDILFRIANEENNIKEKLKYSSKVFKSIYNNKPQLFGFFMDFGDLYFYNLAYKKALNIYKIAKSINSDFVNLLSIRDIIYNNEKDKAKKQLSKIEKFIKNKTDKGNLLTFYIYRLNYSLLYFEKLNNYILKEIKTLSKKLDDKSAIIDLNFYNATQEKNIQQIEEFFFKTIESKFFEKAIFILEVSTKRDLAKVEWFREFEKYLSNDEVKLLHLVKFLYSYHLVTKDEKYLRDIAYIKEFAMKEYSLNENELSLKYIFDEIKNIKASESVDEIIENKLQEAKILYKPFENFQKEEDVYIFDELFYPRNITKLDIKIDTIFVPPFAISEKPIFKHKANEIQIAIYKNHLLKSQNIEDIKRDIKKFKREFKEFFDIYESKNEIIKKENLTVLNQNSSQKSIDEIYETLKEKLYQKLKTNYREKIKKIIDFSNRDFKYRDEIVYLFLVIYSNSLSPIQKYSLIYQYNLKDIQMEDLMERLLKEFLIPDMSIDIKMDGREFHHESNNKNSARAFLYALLRDKKYLLGTNLNEDGFDFYLYISESKKSEVVENSFYVYLPYEDS